MSRILIIDDEEKLRKLIARVIALEHEALEISEAASVKEAVRLLSSEEFDVIISDVKLPDGNGVDLVKVIKGRYPFCEVILLTAYGNIEDSVKAIKSGAFDYITKGDDSKKIIPLLYKALEKAVLAKRVLQLEKQLGARLSFDNIIGKSVQITRAIELAKKVAGTDTTVLLTGETGTGKEVFAQAIHQASDRNKRGFVAINCSAFGKDLLENELFGHRAGAFTGAIKDQKGLFEEAHNGTIFLDEIGEMALELQAKILRVLETGEFLKVGDSKTTRVNVRIIAATNRNLQEEIVNGNFRSDLFYRLSVFTIQLPALRQRKEDVKLLAEYYAASFAVKMGKKHIFLTRDYIDALEKAEWKGNIRELKNVIERSVILSETEALDIDTLPGDVQYPVETDKPLSAFSMASVEKLHIQKVLIHTQGNKTEAARLLEIGPATLYRKIEEYGISTN